MDKRLKNIVVELLKTNYNECYGIYEKYCKAKGIQQEVFRCDYEGINALFENPAEAVFAFVSAGIKPADLGGLWAHIYHNDRLQLSYCDDISEKVNLSPIVDWIFSLEDWDRIEIFEILDELDVAYDICRVICKERGKHICDNFTDWLDDLGYYNLATFVEEDWDELFARFEDTFS